MAQSREQSQPIDQVMGLTLPAAAALAWDRLSAAHGRANELCRLVQSGASVAVEDVCQAMHETAFGAMTLAQVGVFAETIDDASALDLYARASSVQARALSFEQLHRQQALSPSEIFFDDLLPGQAIGPRPADGEPQARNQAPRQEDAL